MEDQASRKGPYHTSPCWERYSARTSNAIRYDGLRDFRMNNRVGKGYAESIAINPFETLPYNCAKSKVYRKITRLPFFRKFFVDPYVRHTEWHFNQTQLYKGLYYSRLLGDWFARFSQKYSLPDTLAGSPRDAVSINGRKIGYSYLTSFLRVQNYSKKVDFEKVESVFEIGGGFGAFCHTLLHLFPNIKKYLYLDIPPILYVGTQYLKHFYGDEAIDYRSTRSSDSISFSPDKKREIIAICPWQIDKVRAEIDLFWNSASFQEMTKEAVINYMRKVNVMLRPESKVCLYVYKKGKPPKTLIPAELIELIERDVPVAFEEIEPEIKINESHYFLGRKK